MPKRNRFKNRNQKPESSAMSSSHEIQFMVEKASRAALALINFCGAPTSSSDDEESKKNNASNSQPPRFAPPAQMGETISTLAAHQLDETTQRRSIEQACQDELMRIEALFCTTDEKHILLRQESAERNALFAQQIFLMHLPIALTIQAEEAQARTEIEMIFKDDETLVQPAFFQPVPKKQDWASWVRRLLPH